MFKLRAVMAAAAIAFFLCLSTASLAQTLSIPRMRFFMPEGVDPTTKFYFLNDGDSFRFYSDVFIESPSNPDPGIELHADGKSRLQFILVKVDLLEGELPNGLLVDSVNNPNFQQFPNPWLIGDGSVRGSGDGSVRSSFTLRWQPGAAKIGQPMVAVADGSYYGALRLVEGELPEGLLFRVTAYAVPEPGTITLLGAALLGGLPLAYRLRRRR